MGVASGFFGVLVAIAFAYGVFRLLAGPGSFSVGPFLASTVPLLVPIRHDWGRARQVQQARAQLLENVAESRDRDTASALAYELGTGHGSAVAGEITGLAVGLLWFFLR